MSGFATASDASAVIGRGRVRNRWVLTGLWLVFSLLTLLPIYWLTLVALRNRVDVMGNFTLLPRDLTLDNVRDVLGDSAFTSTLTNSVVVATANALLSVTVALFAAYALSRFRLPGSENVLFWALTNRMAPAAAFLLPIYLIFSKVEFLGHSLLDSRVGLVLVYTVFNVPFAMWMLKGMIDAIPEELDEAAFVDGAGTMRVLRSVILPVIKPGLAVTLIFTWVFAWNEYLLASRLTSLNARTVPASLAQFVGVTGTNWGELAALSLVTMLPGAVLVSVLQRHIVAGLTAGAVK